MTADLSPSIAAHGGVRRDRAHRSAGEALHILAITLGIAWSVLFVVLGLRYELQFYADGSIFSYSIAVEDAWTFHWHNIAGRLFVYLFCHVPAEIYAALTDDAHGAIVIYGFLFFVAPLLSLIATFAADRSDDRIVFACACLSTACLCPLVFGFPTETWVAHALFWPTLALCYYARPGIRWTLLIFAAMLALVFAYRGALIFAAVIVAMLRLRGAHDASFVRAARVFLAILPIWIVVKDIFPPDAYIADVITRAALHVFDVTLLAGKLLYLLLAALAGYAAVLLLLLNKSPNRAHLYAAAIVAAALAIYWQWFDHALHAECRYYFRTIILVATPALGALAMLYLLRADGALNLRHPVVERFADVLSHDKAAKAAIGAVLLVTLVHAVETTKFIAAWSDYTAAVRALAMGTESDPQLGDERFVSSQRIKPELNRLSWSSTTPYLSVLVAPNFAPARLVVDPTANYFWLSCATATANELADRAVPLESRRLIRLYSCQHRQ